MKYKHIIHDKSILLLILSVTMTLAFFTFGVVFYLSVHDDGKMDFHYENEKVITLVGKDEISGNETDIFVDNTPPKNEVENVIENLCSFNHCNVGMDIECNVGPAREWGKAKIYLNHAEDVSERLRQDYFEYSETSEPYAFVGSEILYMIKDGTINVNAQDIRVAGVLENKTIHDDSRIVLINAMKNPGIKEMVMNTLAATSEYSYIQFGSNMEPFIHTDWETTKNIFKRLNRDMEVQDEIPDLSISMDETLGALTDKIFIGLTLFSLINLISLDVVWFSKKRKDIAIMKTYGYSTNQLVGTFAKEYLLAVVSGAVLSISVSMIWYVLSDKKAIFDYFKEAYLYSLFLIIFIVLIMLLFVTHYAEKVAPAHGINDR